MIVGTGSSASCSDDLSLECQFGKAVVTRYDFTSVDAHQEKRLTV